MTKQKRKEIDDIWCCKPEDTNKSKEQLKIKEKFYCEHCSALYYIEINAILCCNG